MLCLNPGTPRALRVFAVMFAITAMLCVSAASVSAVHAHLNSPSDRCDVCDTAHMAVQQAAPIQFVHTLALQSFLAPPAAVERVASRPILALLTRGPPSSL
jgi:hypothetical protein